MRGGEPFCGGCGVGVGVREVVVGGGFIRRGRRVRETGIDCT